MGLQKVFLTAMAGMFLILVSHCQAQLLSEPGKAWNQGDVNGSNFMQMEVQTAVWEEAGNQGSCSGMFAIKVDGEWSAPNDKSFTGSMTKTDEIVKFDCVCADQTKFRGWYTKGADEFDRADDKVFIYVFDKPGPIETDPCDPDDELLEEEEAEDIPAG